MALARLCAIIHITIILMTRWFTVSCYIFAGYNWSMRSMGIMVDDLEMALADIEEEGGLIMKEEIMMLIFQWIMDELPPFEKYWTHIFQKKSMLVIGECKSKVLPFNILCNEIFSPEEDTNKDTCTILVVTAAKALLANIWDEKKPRRSICQVLGTYYVGIIHPMLTMQLVYSKWQSMIRMKYILAKLHAIFNLMVE